MRAYLIVFDTSLTQAQLRDRRQKLADALQQESIELKTLRVGDDLQPLLTRLLPDAKAAPVIVMDDGHALPGDAPWLAELSRSLIDLTPDRRPQLIYLTEHVAESLPDETLTGTMPTLNEIVAGAQRTAIQNALDRTGGNVAAAAAMLGRNRGSLHRLMKKLGMVTKRRIRVKAK